MDLNDFNLAFVSVCLRYLKFSPPLLPKPRVENFIIQIMIPYHNNKDNKKKNNKNPHQNLPEGSKVQVMNFARGLKFMQEDL